MAGNGVDSVVIRPDWPAPPRVCAAASTRVGGVSEGPWASLNLGRHVDDRPEAVTENRSRLAAWLALESAPLWLDQVHGRRVVHAGEWVAGVQADGCFASGPAEVCVVMTADCLPVLLCDRAGQAVAALHAGWRGLAAGVLDAGVAAFANRRIAAGELLAWLGPAIGADAYEVGPEVRGVFDRPDERAASGPMPAAAGRWTWRRWPGPGLPGWALPPSMAVACAPIATRTASFPIDGTGAAAGRPR